MATSDAEQAAPTPSHMALLAICAPRPERVLASEMRERKVPVTELALWVSDLRGQLGRHIAGIVLQDEDYLARITATRAHTAFCIATTAHEASTILGEWMPDLVVPVLVRPPGIIPVILGDKDDDVRVALLDPFALSTSQ